MTDVFVSYSRSDKALVTPIVAALEAQGWGVWWDPAIVPGQEFDRTIADELARASAVLVVWTQRSVESRWVRGEARDAAERGVLVPLRIGTAALPIDFRAIHTLDLPEGDHAVESPVFREVVQALNALIQPKEAAANGGKPVVERRASGAARVGICVLPFANLGGDPEQAFFSDGFTSDIITELSRWRMLTVRSKSATLPYRGGTTDPMRVARELEVRYVVEGSVRRLGNRVRITVQLVDGESGAHVWGEKFDREQSEIFDVQDQVVQTIAGTLVGRVQMTDAERARRKPTSSLEAYECVQRGNALPWDVPESAAEAARLFEQAIALDPGYAMAHALLGTMRIGQYRQDPASSNAALDEAFTLTQRAVELDDGDSTCHSLFAHACLYRRSFELALQHMRRAVEINPNNPWNRADMGLVLTYAGSAEDALAWMKRAREIDPYFDPPWYWRQTGQIYMALRQFEQALEMFAHVPLRTDRTTVYMAACHARLNQMDQARQICSECLSATPDFSIRQFVSKEPFRDPAETEYLAQSLRMAGLPE